MNSKTAMRASLWVLKRRRSSSSHSSVAKKLSHIALSKQFAVQLDDVVVDARQGHPLFQSGIVLVELLAAAHLDIGFLADDLIDKAAVIGEQVLDLDALATRHPMRVLGGQFLDLFPILDLLEALFQCLHGSLLPAL